MKLDNLDGFQANICLFKVNNRNTRTMCVICSNIKIKTPGVHNVNLEQISHIILVLPWSTLNK